MINNSDFKIENIFPEKIIKTTGNIQNCDALLYKTILQITTDENNCMVMTNTSDIQKASILLDFGKEYNGSIRILTHTTDAEATPEIRISYGESVSEALSSIGEKGATNDHAIRDYNAKLTSFSDITFSESGFRFARIELLSPDTSIRIKAIVLVSKIRNLEYLGTFKCDNEIINKIYDTAAYTCHLCMQQLIWDGIKRDRLVWVGDMHPEMLTVRTVFGNNDIITQSLRFMRKQTPLPCWMNGMPTYSLWWLHILYDWYLYNGDDEFIEENKEYSLALIKKIIALINEDGTDNLPGYFLDWPCNNKPQSISGSRALLALSLSSCAALCKIYGENKLSEECIKKKSILISTELNSFGAKQVTAIASLADWIDRISAGEEILSDGAAGWSTFMSYYLLKAASKSSMTQTLEALQVYYGTMLNMGATTFWEDFDLNWAKNAAPIDAIPDGKHADIHGDFGAFCYKGLRHSLCHGWSSGPVAFLAEEVLGIRIAEPGCKKLILEPDLGNLHFAEGSFPTPQGNVFVSCYKENNTIKTEYTAPDGIEIEAKEKYKGEYKYEFSRNC